MLTFFLRRLSLSLTLVFWQQFFWGQIFFQFMISTGLIILLQWFRPLKEKSANHWEIFNEYANLVFLLLLMLMSDYLLDLQIRQDLGTTYIVCVCLFVLTHVVAIAAGVFCSIRMRFRMCYYKGTNCFSRCLRGCCIRQSNTE